MYKTEKIKFDFEIICNCHCTFMAVLCIGAEQIKVL